MDNQIVELLNTALVSNDKIERWEEFAIDQPQIEIPLKETFVHGMYIREIMIPQGTILTGKVHKHPYVDIMLDGDIYVATPTGTNRLTGYNVLEGIPGRKRAGYAYQDTPWVTVHRTDLVEPGHMEDRLTLINMKDFEIWNSQYDYPFMLEELGFTEAQARLESEQEWDMLILNIPIVKLCDSPIEGKGLFAAEKIEKGFICPARIGNQRTQAGRFVNHSPTPNCEMRIIPRQGSSIVLVALEDIEPDTELTTDYRNTISERSAAREIA
jgi:hypothetical protein